MKTMITDLRNEKHELTKRIITLKEFMDSDEFYSLSAHQRSLIQIQLPSMETYWKCLDERLWEMT